MAWSITDLFTTSEYGFPKAITASCPASGTTTSMKAKAEELDRTWEPTGYYTWQQMADLVAAAVEMSSKASSMAIQAFTQNPNDILRGAADEYHQVARKASEDYVPAWKAAQASNAPVSAPGFKRWVVELLNASYKLMRISEISVCTAPWWYGALSTYMYYFNKLVDLAKTIGGIVVAAGAAVVHAVEGVFSLWPFVKWGGLAIGVLFGGVYLWNRLHYTAERARQPIKWSEVFESWGKMARAGRGKVRGLFKKTEPTVAGRRLLR